MKPIDTICVNYPNVDTGLLQRNASRFLGSLSKRGWVADWRCVVSGEGGYASLKYNCMMQGLLHDPMWDVGFKEYGTFLVETYGQNRMDNNCVSLAALQEAQELLEASQRLGVSLRLIKDTFPQEEEEKLLLAGCAFSAPPSERLPGEVFSYYTPSRTSLIQDPEEEYMMLAYANTGSVREAAEYCGLTYSEGWNIIRRVRRRANDRPAVYI